MPHAHNSDASSDRLSVSQLPALRRRLKQQRAALTAEQLQQHSQLAATHFERLLSGQHRADKTGTEQTTSAVRGAANSLNRPIRIALYCANRGELDCLPLQSRLASRGALYWPIVTGNSLTFGPLAEAALQLNSFGIAEPIAEASARLNADELDILVLPLLAFDDSGNRLGMGGGFYDRALANCKGYSPLLVGYGHSFQQVAALPAQPWDKKIHAVVTEHGSQWFTTPPFSR